MIVLLQTLWSELQTGVIAEPVLDHLASNWNVWWNRSWLDASVSFALQEKKKERKKTTRLPSCGQANKIKESPCGLSLAKQQRSAKNWNTMWIYNKNMGKKNMHLTWICTTEAVLVRTGVGVLSQHDLPSSVTPVKHQLPIGWDQLMNLPLFETAKNDIAILKPPSRRNFSFVWLVPSVFPKP